MKKCYKCQLEKDLNEFSKDKQKRDGLNSSCKECVKFFRKLDYTKNQDLYKEKAKNRYHSHKDYYTKHRQDNIEKYKQYDKEFQTKTSWRKNYRKNNRECEREYEKKRYIKNIHINRWRTLLNNTLNQLNTPKSFKTHNLLKYSAQDLKEHLDKQGMIWGEHEIDHKIPITWFKSNTPSYVVNDLRNLQPLNSTDNKKKGNRFGSLIEDSYIPIIKDWIKEKYIKFI
jgi:hypothetical protein